MRVIRAPLRITLAGGATDQPSYADRYGGLVIGVALRSYVYLCATPSFTDEYILRYAEMERTEDPQTIRHTMLRALIQRAGLPPYELVSLADVPAGTGLGSSGAFATVCAKLLADMTGKGHTALALAESAFRLESEAHGPIVGRQDSAIATYGGIHCYQFGRREQTVTAIGGVPLEEHLTQHCFLVATGITRPAAPLLTDQVTRTDKSDPLILTALHHQKAIAEQLGRAIHGGDFAAIGTALAEQWRHKRVRSPGMTTAKLDAIHDDIMDAGAQGARLVGAGGGGFFLVYAADASATRLRLRERGYRLRPIRVDHQGCTEITV